MKLSGECDFCGRTFNCEGIMCNDRTRAIMRPEGIAAIFPWNRKKLPPTCTFGSGTLEQHKITTRGACAECYRLDFRGTGAGELSRPTDHKWWAWQARRLARLTERQRLVLRLIYEQADKDGTDAHGGIRDMLTDLHYVSAFLNESWRDLLRGAGDVYREERVLV